MKPHRLLAIGTFLLCYITAIAAKAEVSEVVSWARIKGKTYTGRASFNDLVKNSTWNSGADPLPVSITEAIAIAKKEFQQHSTEAVNFKLDSVQLVRASLGLEVWIYRIHLYDADIIKGTMPSELIVLMNKSSVPLVEDKK